MENLSDPSTRIVFVELNQTRRMAISDMLRTLKYTSIQSMPTVKDLINHLATEPVMPDWIITPLADDESVNAMHLLDLTVRNPFLAGCRVSVTLADREVWWLHHAFELGLLSWHVRTRNVQDLAADLVEVLNFGEYYGWDNCAVSAEYLRRHLVHIKRHEDLLHLEQTLLGLRPNLPGLPVRLAEALHLSGKDDAALAVLGRAGNLDKNATARAKALRDQLAAGANASSMVAFAQEWGLGRAVIVDPDESVCSFVKSVFAKIGIGKVETFTRSDAAWEHLSKSEEPDVIVQEWKLPGVSGSSFLQRLRAHGFRKASIFIHSALVGPSDRQLLREMGASDVIQKPLGQQQLAQALMTAIKEEKRPSEVATLERSVRNALAGGDVAVAKQHLLKLEANPKTSPGVMKGLEAELAFIAGDFKAANRLAVEALQVLGEDILLLSLLGKIYMKLRLFENAAKFFDRADKLSPGNVQRLCALAESHAEAGGGAAAADRLQQAKKLDPTNEAVAETEAKVALAGGAPADAVKELLMHMPDSSSVVAFLNNRGVALSAEGRFDEAIKLYEKALKSLPKALEALKPTIAYNLSLALIRKGDLDAARWQLSTAAQVKGSPVQVKARSLLDRAAAAASKKEPLVLKSAAKDEEPDADEASEQTLDTGRGLPVAAGMRPGAMRCHLVFQPIGPVDKRFLTLLANPPKLVKRAIDYGGAGRGKASAGT